MKVLLLIGVIVLLFCLLSLPKHSKAEKYGYGDNSHEYWDYKQMSRLPWCTPPTGIGALGRAQCAEAQARFPGRVYYTGTFPISCPPWKISLYDTGDSLNPNVYSTWGVITPNEIRY